ncbi:MAG: polyphosphate kinase 2 family protein [Sphingobacteriaceae bacterium]|nr:polyphosphate kinase 2 family protein [Sphingobacteriaceae bacterium]
MEFSTEIFRVTDQSKIKLSDVPTELNEGIDKIQATDLLARLKYEMFQLQEKLYAENKHSLLIIFQAMDAAGKDSAIKHVMSGLNPQGCQVYSFKQPTSEELDHDFLWRHYKALPERGRIGIHNRSHYENVLVCKVHPTFASNESQVPLSQINDKFWKSRYKSIRNFEEHLNASGTTVIKFFLNISKEEQKKRFLKRIEDPAKNWKFSSSDLIEREQWENYMKAYEDVFEATSTDESRWFIIPADKKWFARVAICKIIVDTLKAIDPKYPVLEEKESDSLQESKEKLLSGD